MESPQYYADLASEAEKRGDFLEAAKQWIQAGHASLGHNRRARYEEAAARCTKTAELKKAVSALDLTVDEDSHIVVGKHIVFVKVRFDDACENPLDTGTNGTLYSFSSRHANYLNPQSTQAADIREKFKEDIVFLSYYEHGQCLWFPQGTKAPAGVEFEWDGVRTAGMWVPEGMEEDVAGLTGEARMARLLEIAKGVCAEYTSWCNGDVYRFDVAIYDIREEGDEYYDARSDYRRQVPYAAESVGGFIGWEHFEDEVRATVLAMLAEVTNLQLTE